MQFYVLTLRDVFRSPAMCCVVEFEDVIVASTGAMLLRSVAEIDDPSNSFVFCAALYAGQLSSAFSKLRGIRKRGAIVCLYIFDCMNVKYAFFNKRRRVKRLIFPELDIDNVADIICLSAEEGVDQLMGLVKAKLRHVPFGVHSRLSDVVCGRRTIDVVGYGRQPGALTALLSTTLNDAGSSTFFYHTDHAQIGEIIDYYAHRRMFWTILRKSKIALAYDVVFEPGQRNFPVSFVGQRWFECLAAGCVVVGKRPRTREAGGLLDWSSATIELNDDPTIALHEIQELLRDDERIHDCAERNWAGVRQKHDWSYRIRDILTAWGLSVPEPLAKYIEARQEVAKGQVAKTHER